MDVSVTFDAELGRLIADLGAAGGKVTTGAIGVMTKAAVNIKKGMQADFSGHRHAPAIPRAINFDQRGLSIEVGVDKAGPQGGLGNLLAFGSSKNAAVVDHTAALRRELPNVEKYLGDLGEKALK